MILCVHCGKDLDSLTCHSCSDPGDTPGHYDTEPLLQEALAALAPFAERWAALSPAVEQGRRTDTHVALSEVERAAQVHERLREVLREREKEE